MAEKRISSDVESARKILDELWQTVMREKGGETTPDIDRLIDSRFVGYQLKPGQPATSSSCSERSTNYA